MYIIPILAQKSPIWFPDRVPVWCYPKLVPNVVHHSFAIWKGSGEGKICSHKTGLNFRQHLAAEQAGALGGAVPVSTHHHPGPLAGSGFWVWGLGMTHNILRCPSI